MKIGIENPKKYYSYCPCCGQNSKEIGLCAGSVAELMAIQDVFLSRNNAMTQHFEGLKKSLKQAYNCSTNPCEETVQPQNDSISPNILCYQVEKSHLKTKFAVNCGVCDLELEFPQLKMQSISFKCNLYANVALVDFAVMHNETDEIAVQITNNMHCEIKILLEAESSTILQSASDTENDDLQKVLELAKTAKKLSVFHTNRNKMHIKLQKEKIHVFFVEFNNNDHVKIALISREATGIVKEK